MLICNRSHNGFELGGVLSSLVKITKIYDGEKNKKLEKSKRRIFLMIRYRLSNIEFYSHAMPMRQTH